MHARAQSTPPKAPNSSAVKSPSTEPEQSASSSHSASWWMQSASLYSSLVANVPLPWNSRTAALHAFSESEDKDPEHAQDSLGSASKKPAVKVDPPPQKPSSRSLEYAPYLNPVGYLETRYTRMMASLSSIAYRMDRLTPAYLRRMHNIELLHTSLACEIGFKNEVVSSEQELAEDHRLGDGMAGMAPAFTETALIEEVQQPQRPPEPLSSASELATARAYDHFHPAIPGPSSDSGEAAPPMLEGYTVWSPSRQKRRHRRPELSDAPTGHDETNEATHDNSTFTNYARLAENLNSIDTHPDQQPIMPAEFLTPKLPSFDLNDTDNFDESTCPNSPRRFYESEPLLVGALADRAQWWDYDASAYSDMESDGMLSDVEDGKLDASTDGSRQPNDMFCALDMLSRVWPGSRRRSSARTQAAEAAHATGNLLDEHVEGPELKDFAGGMEGDIMQAAAIATANMQACDAEEVGYLEKLRQRVLAVSTVKEVTFAAGAARQPPRRAGVPKPDTRDSEGHSCPVHWFVADDPSSNIRFFSLQGSDSLDSWRANLSFDPVVFEDAGLGVSVHRGMYEAALALYPRFAPMVAEHLASSPFARISFTGHSLGGSISTILAIMMVHRKLVRPSQLSPIYTFGAAACFCEADHVEQIACGVPALGDATDVESDSVDMPAHSKSSIDSGLMRALGIPRDTVRNIILTHDIVPRAFACDYTPVAAMLRQVFTQHLGLQCDDRSIMYHFVGRLLVLQPDEELSWVNPGEGHHPLLPPKAGLYELIEPDMLSRTRQLALSSMDALESLLANETGRRGSGSARTGSAGARGTGSGFLPSAWLRSRSGLSNAGIRRSVSSRSAAASSEDDATCSAVEGYPSPCSPPLAATASLGRQAYWQSLSTSLADTGASAFTLDLEAQLGPDLKALLSPFTDRSTVGSSSAAAAPPVPPSVPFSSIDEPDKQSPVEDGTSVTGSGPPSKPLLAPHAAVGVTPATQSTLHHAELAMLDTPHPLKVLADPGAYGDRGMISRFHHPDHYTQALGSVVRSNLAPFRQAAGRINMARFSTLLRARMRMLQADPMAAWHSAVWDLQAVIAAEGERLHLRPTGPVFGAASWLESSGIDLPNKFP